MHTNKPNDSFILIHLFALFELSIVGISFCFALFCSVLFASVQFYWGDGSDGKVGVRVLVHGVQRHKHRTQTTNVELCVRACGWHFAWSTPHSDQGAIFTLCNGVLFSVCFVLSCKIYCNLADNKFQWKRIKTCKFEIVYMFVRSFSSCWIVWNKSEPKIPRIICIWHGIKWSGVRQR